MSLTLHTSDQTELNIWSSWFKIWFLIVFVHQSVRKRQFPCLESRVSILFFSQWCAQVCHLQATVTCRQQNRGSRRAGVSGGQTGVRCLYFPCGGLWLLWSLCHTTISNSSNSNAEGVERETESSYFRPRQKDRLAKKGRGGKRRETESNGSGQTLSSVLKKVEGFEVPAGPEPDLDAPLLCGRW